MIEQRKADRDQRVGQGFEADTQADRDGNRRQPGPLFDNAQERRQRASGRRNRENGSIAIVDASYGNERLLARARRVISGELAERPFPRRDVLDHLAFEHDLGMRRHGQAV